MNTAVSSASHAETAEQDLARKLLQQVAECKSSRRPARTRAAAGVQVERCFRRQMTGCASEKASESARPQGDRYRQSVGHRDGALIVRVQRLLLPFVLLDERGEAAQSELVQSGFREPSSVSDELAR
ncbi:hypothetical protein ACVWXN_000540 [Bradyrhizobium sp. i1.4.4]|uniref:Uncharacterized protein n=1 Tax=Bradyrhizobium japonicum TaxID=375 RepID=A0A1Y2JVN3_BRAJP|nr:hypothetical protein [Bradyrhizobium japonicum]OSJ36181.1 hypothetical protein BSZ19_05415 [Bradyrhizobium japonicum]